MSNKPQAPINWREDPETMSDDPKDQIQDLKMRLGQAGDECDGHMMMIQAYEAKINGLTQNLHQKEKIMAQLRAQASAAERLSLKVVRMALDRADDAREETLESAGMISVTAKADDVEEEVE